MGVALDPDGKDPIDETVGIRSLVAEGLIDGAPTKGAMSCSEVVLGSNGSPDGIPLPLPPPIGKESWRGIGSSGTCDEKGVENKSIGTTFSGDATKAGPFPGEAQIGDEPLSCPFPCPLAG